jgi:O-antigen/teichoic acid export membrane protein
MNSTTRERFLQGFGATAIGPMVTILAQVISVPVLLRSWGPRLYGEWLILSAIPTYIAFSDVGFGNVAANDMTMRVASGDRDGALVTFQSTWIFITMTSLLVVVCFMSGAWMMPLGRWLNLSLITPQNARVILTILCIYALLCLQADLTTAGFRCEGNYALGMLIKNMLRLVETLGVTIIVAAHAKPIQAAATYLILRAIGTPVMAWLMMRKTVWLRYGLGHATRQRTKSLAVPAVAFMAFPAGSALSLQGMVIVIAALLGPVAVAVFSTMRTLTRFGFQIMEALKNSVWPELSLAYGVQNWALARKLHRVACQASLWSSIGSAIFLYFAGGKIIELWTHGRIVMDVTAFHWLLLVIVANSFWYTSSVVTVASNTHERVAAVYLAGTAASLLIARLLIPSFGISGAAMALLAIDLIVGWYVISSSLAALSESAIDFYASMFRLPELSFRK